MSKRVLRGARLAVALSFLALLSSLAIACGRQGRVESPPARIRLAFTKNLNAGLVLIALAKDYFSKEGLELVAEGTPYGKVALQDLLEGRADIATVADTPFVIAVLGGARISVLSSIQTSNRDEAIVVRRDRGVEGPADLKGKTIGLTRGTTSDYFAYIFLLAQGIDIKDVKIVDLGPRDIAEALASGKVDAVSTWNPMILDIKRSMGERVEIFYEENLYTETMCLVSGSDYALGHPEEVRRVLKALLDAERFVHDHAGEALDILSGFLEMGRAEIEPIWADFDYEVALDQGLLVDFEDQTRWFRRINPERRVEMPNYLDNFYLAGLEAAEPGAVGLIH